VARLLLSDSYRGSMLSVGLSEGAASEYISKLSVSDELIVACINSPDNVTISGKDIAIDDLKASLDKDSIFNRKLAVNVAYHSPQMEKIATDYLESLGDLDGGQPKRRNVSMVSSITGNFVPIADLQKSDYWVRNLTSPVRFVDALSKFCVADKTGTKKLGVQNTSLSATNILEIGPHSTLQGPIKSLLKKMKANITYSSCLVRNLPAVDSFATAVGQLYCFGYKVDVSKINECVTSQPKMSLHYLPQYPFDHSRTYWHESRVSRGWRFRKYPRLDLLGAPDSNWNPMEARWRNYLRVTELPWLEGHKVR
jgi:acyl transferase domain-containing protein